MREPAGVLPAMCAEALPSSIARTLTGLGVAANDLSLALSEARLQQSRAAMQLHRASDLEDVLGKEPAEYQPLGSWFEAARNYSEQLVAIYAQLAGAYAAYAVEVFSALQGRRSLTELAVPRIVPSDLLTMPQILLPLVQLKVNDDDDDDDHIRAPQSRPGRQSPAGRRRDVHTAAR
jgi:hypothetical protein